MPLNLGQPESEPDAKILDMFTQLLQGQTEMKQDINGMQRDIVERLERVETKIEVLQMETAHIRQVN